MVATAKEMFQPDLIQDFSCTRVSDMVVRMAAASRECLVL
jgi:hypothetical protein